MANISSEHIKAFKKHAKALDRLIREIKKYEPYANYYLAMDTLHLMVGDSHNRDTAERQDENSVASVSIYTAGGGDW